MKTKTIDRKELDELVDPLTVINNGFELLKHRFENTMDAYALAEFSRIERSLAKLTNEIEKLRDETISEELN